MGSDGIFDNLFVEDVKLCLNANIHRSNLKVQDAANCLSTYAEIKGYDPKYDSPFAIEARAHKKRHPGGKSDDITVIVA